MTCSDFNQECHQNSTYIQRIRHLVSEHSLTSFWSHAEQGRQLLDEIRQLLLVIPDRQTWINDIIELCNPYNYTLIRSLLETDAEENEKVTPYDYISSCNYCLDLQLLLFL